MKELHDIMTDFEVTPSQDCWQKLSHRLDVAMPQVSTSTQAASKALSASHSTGSTIFKVVVATLSTAAVATSITLAVVNSHNDSTSPNEQPAAQIVQDTTSNPENEEVNISAKHAITIDKNIDNLPTPTDTASHKANVTEIGTSVKTTAVNSITSDNLPKANAKPMSLHVKPRSLKPIGNITLPSITPISTAAQDDPAVQQHEDEIPDFQEPVKLEIPNVFTPNGDGVNDYFVIKGLDNCNIRQLSVHDRGGHVVFKSNSYENNWNGDNCSDGVYYYQLTIDNHGIQQTMTGSVTIIRR